MAAINSKNLFALLGDDDTDGLPAPVYDKTERPRQPAPAKEIPAKQTASHKRDPSAATPRERHMKTANEGKTFKDRPRQRGNEGAFRDREVGHQANASKPVEDGQAGGAKRGSSTRGGRGGRGGASGGRGRGREFDRRSSTGVRDSNKQIIQGWGDEGKAQASAEDIAARDRADEAEESAVPTVNDNGEEVVAAPDEPQSNEKSYEEYLAERKARAPQLPATLTPRTAEGSSELAQSARLNKPEEQNYFQLSTGTKKEKTSKPKKTKQYIDIEQIITPEQTEQRSSRGNGRGGARGSGRGNGARGNAARGARGSGRSAPSTQRFEFNEANFPALA